MHTKCWSEKPERRHHLGDIGVDGKIILGWILQKYDVRELT